MSATTPARTPVTPVIEGAPGAPSTLTAQLDGSGGVTLGWTDPDDNAITGYRILRGVDALSMRIIVENTGSSSVGHTDTTAAVNSAHVYAVQARNAAGLSQLSNTVSVTTLSAPTELDTSAASGRVSLNWSVPDLSAITGYRVMRGTTAASLRQIAQVSGRSNTFYTDFDVLPVSQYHYAVRALSAQGSSPLSETVSATTQPVTTVSRYIRFDEDNRLVPRQSTTVTDTVMVSNQDRPDATYYATGGAVEPYRGVVGTNSVGSFGFAAQFRTGLQPGGYNLSSVRAAITNTSTDDSSSVQPEAKARVRIFEEHRGRPGHVVHTLGEVTVASGASNVTTTFTAEANATLQPNTAYWALFEETSSRSGLSTSDVIRFNIPLTRHSLEDACSVPGWSIGDDHLTADIVSFAVIFSDATSDGADQGPSSPKFAILGSPRDGSVSENRCHDLPQAITTTGTLLIGGLAIGSLYPNPTDRDWFEVTLEANVLYQFDVFHSQRVHGREGTTTGNARVHRILDSTGTAVTSGVTYLEHSISGNPGDRVFFTPTAAGAYYLELGAGASPSLLSDRLDQLVNWGTCTGHLPDPTRQVQGDTVHLAIPVGGGTVNFYYETWRHPNYDGWWEQRRKGDEMISCHRRFTHDIRGGGIYYVRANVADEYTAGTDTAGAFAPGRRLQGYLYQNNGSNTDVDWAKISLTAGTTYRFTYQINSPGQTGPRITGVFDSGGTMVHGSVSGTYKTLFKRVTLEYTPTTAGNYYIGLTKTGASRDARWQLSVSN